MVKCLHLCRARSNHTEAVYTQQTNNSIHKITIYLVDITPSQIMVKCLHLRHVRSNHSEAVCTQHNKQFNPQNHNLLSRYYTISHYGQMSPSPSCEIHHSEAVYTQHNKQFNPQNHNLFSRYYTISHYGQMSRSPSCEIQP